MRKQPDWKNVKPVRAYAAVRNGKIVLVGMSRSDLNAQIKRRREPLLPGLPVMDFPVDGIINVDLTPRGLRSAVKARVQIARHGKRWRTIQHEN